MTTLTGQVARLLFERQLTKVEIAPRLGISRFRVARQIDQALANGVVRIEFRDAPDQDLPLARAVEERFGLDLCVVVDADGARAMAAMARLAGDLVDGLLGAGKAIGIAWGTTVVRVEAMPQRSDPSIDVVQLAGSSTSLDARNDPGDLTRVLAARLGGRPHRIHAPRSSSLPSFGRHSSVSRKWRRRWPASTTWRSPSSGSARWDPRGRRRARRSSDPGRCRPRTWRGSPSWARSATCSSIHFDAAGRFVAPEIAERAVVIDVERLRGVPRLVAVAAGLEKVAAIRGALATGVIRVLVTDSATASGLVETELRRPRAARTGTR